MAKEKYFTRYESPIGRIYAVCAHEGGCAVEAVFVGGGAEAEFRRLYGHLEKRRPCRALKRFSALLKRYFSGQKTTFDVPRSLVGSPFQKRVWKAIEGIPYGEVRTYAEVARSCSSPKAFRAVGGACGRNPLPIIIPCHRVVSSAGLGGYSGGGAAVKRRLLRLEGALK